MHAYVADAGLRCPLQAGACAWQRKPAAWPSTSATARPASWSRYSRYGLASRADPRCGAGGGTALQVHRAAGPAPGAGWSSSCQLLQRDDLGRQVRRCRASAADGAGRAGRRVAGADRQLAVVAGTRQLLRELPLPGVGPRPSSGLARTSGGVQAYRRHRAADGPHRDAARRRHDAPCCPSTAPPSRCAWPTYACGLTMR